MKRIMVIMAIALCVVTFSVIVYANVSNIEATKVQYPIIVDSVRIDKDIPMISIEDRIYLPIRAMCEVLKIGIDWNEEGRVEIMTNRADAENDRVEAGYYGIEGWTATETLDFKITKETAVTIADDVFLQMKGKDFLKETIVGIDETDDGTCYSVYRYKEPIVPGGDLSVIIRKSDGKIARIVAGE